MSDDANTVARPELPDATASNADAAINGPRPATRPTLGTRYLLGEEIARGGMGAVLRATDAVLNREVAVKVLQERFGLGSATARRFEEEARITGQLQHPNIPAIYDLGTLPDGRPFLAMKLIKGETLEKLLKSSSTSERGRLIAVFEQICQAVAYAHAHDVIHRDLKPANIMVGAFGEVQVMDWGLAKVLSERRDVSSPVSAEGMLPESDDPEATAPATEIRSERERDELHTHAGSVMGTPAYMPPEQAIGAIDQVDQQSDVFGLGGLLAAILTGNPPYVGESTLSTLQMAAAGEIEDCFGRLNACQAEPELVELCKRCLAPKKADRPKDAAELADAVAQFRLEAEERAREAELEAVRVEGERAKAAEQRKRRRTQLTLAAAVMLILGLVAVGAVIIDLWQDAEQAKGAETAARKDAELAKVQVEQEREKLAMYEYGRTIQIAHQEWEKNNVSEALALINSTNSRIRGWEWNYINRICHAELLTLKRYPQNHIPAGCMSVVFNQDSSRIVTADWDNQARVWDTKTGNELFTLKGHTDGVRCLALSEDCSKIVTGSRDTTAKIWNMQTGKELHTLSGHTDMITSVSWCPGSSLIVTGSADNTAKLWDSTTGSEQLTLKGHHGGIAAVSWSPDATQIVTGSQDGTAKIWDAKSGEERLTLKGHHGEITAVSWSPDGSQILTASTDTTAMVWNVVTGQFVLILKGHARDLTAATFSQDGTKIATGSSDKSAKIWNAKSGLELTTLRGHVAAVLSVSFSRDGRLLATGSFDGTAKVWDATTDASHISLTNERNWICSAAFYNPSRIITGGIDGTITIWDAITHQAIFTINGHRNQVYSVSLSTDRKRAITASADDTAKIWDLESGTAVLTLIHKDLKLASFSTGCRQVVTGSHDGIVKLWDLQSGQNLLTFNAHTGAVNSASFSSNDTRIVTAGDDNTAKIWDSSTGVELLVLGTHSDDVTSAEFSHDSSRIVTASIDGTAKVWDANTGLELLTLTSYTQGDIVRSASFNPDGSRIVTGNWDGAWRLWDAKTGAELMMVKGHMGALTSADFSPDGSTIITVLKISATTTIYDSRPFRETRPANPLELAPVPRLQK